MAPRTISDYMSRDVVSLGPDTEINQAVVRFLNHGISGAPVLDGFGRLIGMLTAKDCFKAVLHASYHQSSGGIVADFMSRNVVTLDASVDLVTAAQRFLESPYRRFPVMSDARLVGILSRSDLLRALADQW